MSNSNDIPERKSEFRRVSYNTIYFIEKHWNFTHSISKLTSQKERNNCIFVSTRKFHY